MYARLPPYRVYVNEILPIDHLFYCSYSVLVTIVDIRDYTLTFICTLAGQINDIF